MLWSPTLRWLWEFLNHAFLNYKKQEVHGENKSLVNRFFSRKNSTCFLRSFLRKFLMSYVQINYSISKKKKWFNISQLLTSVRVFPKQINNICFLKICIVQNLCRTVNWFTLSQRAGALSKSSMKYKTILLNSFQIISEQLDFDVPCGSLPIQAIL